MGQTKQGRHNEIDTSYDKEEQQRYFPIDFEFSFHRGKSTKILLKEQEKSMENKWGHAQTRIDIRTQKKSDIITTADFQKQTT